jgi:hypothetical protein
MSWVSTGGFETEIEKTVYGPSRFYLKVGAEDAQITFVDDTNLTAQFQAPDGSIITYTPPVMLKEHQLQINGDWRNWFTCLAQLDQACPICQARLKASQTAILTVIDHSQWTDKKGKVHKDELKIFAVKTSQSAYKLLLKLHKRNEGLRGLTVNASRLGDKSAGVGDQYEVVKKVVLPVECQPLPYGTIFAPKTPRELRAALAGLTTDASTTKASGSKAVDDDEDAVDY